nr:methyltransferase domain-containing protein [Deltaproteobacteria bacterium]
TLGMVIDNFCNNQRQQKMSFSILGTDISPEVLKTAQRAIYHEMRIAPVPMAMRKKYLLRSKFRDKELVKIVPELRKKVQFERLNFMDKDFGIKRPFDIIFCRNVIIYFDKPTQEQILNHLCRHLVNGGYFFQGHSESIQGMSLPLKPVTPTVYRKI